MRYFLGVEEVVSIMALALLLDVSLLFLMLPLHGKHIFDT